ncbi:MAG TPA: shikimate dehydrogenase [Chitinophagaceae bacterium]
MRLFGLIGYPLTHSFSEKYFTEKFEREGLMGCRFENFSISSIDQFTSLLQHNPGLQGIAVTIPYKQSVMQFLDSTENIPVGLNACNCIRIKDGKLYGYNTDHVGFEKSLIPLLKPHHAKALVLGNGGATEAVIFALKKLGIDYDIVSRQLHKGSTLTYRDITAELIKENTIIINTTPLGMYPKIDECPPIPYEYITKDHLLYDLIYNPEKTLFLQKGEEQGAVIKNGYEMLMLQAEENWNTWNL